MSWLYSTFFIRLLQVISVLEKDPDLWNINIESNLENITAEHVSEMLKKNEYVCNQQVSDIFDQLKCELE